MSVRLLMRVVPGLIALAVLALSAPAQAAFPGANGKIAFLRIGAGSDNGIYTMNPDGTGVQNVTMGVTPFSWHAASIRR